MPPLGAIGFFELSRRPAATKFLAGIDDDSSLLLGFLAPA